MKQYTIENFNIKKVQILNCLEYTCINTLYSDFVNKFMRAIYSVAPVKKVRAKANCKPLFDTEIFSAIQKRDKLYSRYKKSGLGTGKDKLNP